MVDFKSLVPWRNNKSQVPATREDFFDPFVTFRREMDRMFDDFFGSGALRPAAAGWQAITPAVDIDETDKELVVTAELPGVSDKDVEVSLAGDILTIRGEKKAEHERQADADTTRPRALMLGQLVGQNGDKDEIVDPKHHLHGDEHR